MLANEQENLEIEPRNFQDRSDSSKWIKVMKAELAAHDKIETWKITPTLQGYSLLSTEWVYSLKRDLNGRIERYKTRLVVRGFEQRYGIDFKETYSPVASIESIKLIFMLATQKELELRQFDVTTAFLHGSADEDIYLAPPDGLKIEEGMCLKLNKALYGLKQAP